jgi:hypothetical protein
MFRPLSGWHCQLTFCLGNDISQAFDRFANVSVIPGYDQLFGCCQQFR